MSGTLTPCRLRSTRFQRPWPGALLLARLFPRMPPVIRHRRFFCALRVRCGCHGPGVRGLCPPPGPRSAFRFFWGLGRAPDWRKARRRFCGLDLRLARAAQARTRSARSGVLLLAPMGGTTTPPIGCFVLRAARVL